MYLQTPFHDFWKQQGAVFKNYEEFQYALPEHFGSIEEEYKALSNSCACIDFSYYGHLRITGKNALDFLNRMSTNDLRKLNVNEYIQTVLTNEKGRIIDLITVYRQPDGLLITTSPENHDSVIKWLEKYIIMDDVKIENLSGKALQLGLIGPLSPAMVSLISKTDPPSQNRFLEFIIEEKRIIVCPSHQLADGFLLIADVSAINTLWNFVIKKNITLCGTEAYTMVRIHQKKPVFRRELSEKYNPLEAGLLDAISFNKGCYIGQEVIARIDAQNKTLKRLVKLKSHEVISENSRILIDDKEVGVITSASYSYINAQSIALGYVKTEFTSSKNPIKLAGTDKTILAEFSS